MVEIINFETPRQRALNQFGERIVAHLAVACYRRNILHIPVQAFTRKMIDGMAEDSFEYTEEVLNIISSSVDTLERIEAMFINQLREQGMI